MDFYTRMRQLLMVLILQPGAEVLSLKAGETVRLWLLKDGQGHSLGLEIAFPTTAETAAWVQSVTPEQNQMELEADGKTAFDFELSELNEDPWIRVAIEGKPGDYRVRAQRKRATA